MVARRLKELLGIWMIGEGAMTLLRPSEYLRLWDGGPTWYHRFITRCARRPDTMRVVGLLEVVGGMFLAVRQTER